MAEKIPTLIERMRVAIAEPISFAEHQFEVGVSIGSAFYSSENADLDELLRLADLQMYREKTQQKGKAAQE